MTEAAEPIEHQEGPDPESLVEEWEAEASAAEEEAEQLTPEQREKIRKMARKMNAGFLWGVEKTQCPHVELKKVVKEEEGIEAFQPLAERLGGETPEWLERWMPYIGAGIYMGTTIATARKAEAQVIEYMKQKRAQEAQGGAADGEEREP